MAERMELLVCALYIVVYFLLQSQDVAQDFGAVCTPEFFLFKKVIATYSNYLILKHDPSYWTLLNDPSFMIIFIWFEAICMIQPLYFVKHV
jgi:hypothetical protein